MTGLSREIGQSNPISYSQVGRNNFFQEYDFHQINKEIQHEVQNLFSKMAKLNVEGIDVNDLAGKIVPVVGEQVSGERGIVSHFNKIINDIKNIRAFAQKIQKMNEKNNSASLGSSKPSSLETFETNKLEVEKKRLVGALATSSITLSYEINGFAVRITKYLEKFFLVAGEELSTYQKISGLAAGSLSKISLISDLLHLVRATNLLNEELMRLKELKKQEDIPQAELNKIEKELKKLKFNVEKLKENYFFKLVGSLPGIADNIYSYVKYIGKIANNAKVGAGISIAGSVLGLISSARDVHEKNKLFDLHEKYTEDLNPGKIQTSDEGNEVLRNLKEKRKLRLEQEKKTFEPWLQNLINQGDYDLFTEELKKIDLALDPSIDSFEKLTFAVKQKLLEDKVERNTTLTTIAKSQLRERLQAQEKINRSLFSFKLTQSQINFALAVVTTAAAITMTVMIAGGTVFPPVFILALSFLGAAQTFGCLGIGMAHLYQNKPNLAKTYFKLVQVDIMFTKIPHLFSNWQLTRAREKSERLSEDLKAETDSGVKNELQKEKDILDASIKDYEESYEKYDKKMQRLENKISKARKKDFEQKTGFTAFSEDLPRFVEKKGLLYEERKNLVKLSKDTNSSEELKSKTNTQIALIDKKIAFYDQRINTIKGDAKDEFQIIAEALIKGEFWKDAEAAAFLKKYGGAELNEKLAAKDLQENPSILSEKLKNFILKNSEQILNWLEEQQIEEVSLYS